MGIELGDDMDDDPKLNFKWGCHSERTWRISEPSEIEILHSAHDDRLVYRVNLGSVEKKCGLKLNLGSRIPP